MNHWRYFSAAFLRRRRHFSLHKTARPPLARAERRASPGMCHRDRFCLIPVISELLLGHLIRLGAKCHNKGTGCSLLFGLFCPTASLETCCAPLKRHSPLASRHSLRVRYSPFQTPHSTLVQLLRSYECSVRARRASRSIACFEHTGTHDLLNPSNRR